MSRTSRKRVLTVESSPVIDDVNRDFVFHKVSSGFFCEIRSDILNECPQLWINLVNIESIEFFEIGGDLKAGRRVFLTSGKVYELKSQSQVVDLTLGLHVLKQFLITGKVS